MQIYSHVRKVNVNCTMASETQPRNQKEKFIKIYIYRYAVKVTIAQLLYIHTCRVHKHPESKTSRARQPQIGPADAIIYLHTSHICVSPEEQPAATPLLYTRMYVAGDRYGSDVYY